MPYKVPASVIGIALEPFIQDSRRSLEETLYDVSCSALSDAGVSMQDIDGIVVAGNDQYDGRAISVMAASGSVGGVDRDILSTPSASEHAFVLGALRVSSGQFRFQLVVSWSPTEATSLRQVQRLAADPYFHRRLPLDELSSHALQAVALQNAFPGLDQLACQTVVKNRRHGLRAYPNCGLTGVSVETVAQSKLARWPLREGMLATPVTGAVAMVLASADVVSERDYRDVAWIQGMGWATEPSFLGDRDLSDAPSLNAAAQQAYGEAGITDPTTAFDLAEVADASPYQELLACQALGLCRAEDLGARVADGSFAHGGRLPINLSGGATSLNPVYCAGLIRIAEAANQVRGRAGPHQHERRNRALAHASSGFAMQYNTVIVLGTSPVGAPQ